MKKILIYLALGMGIFGFGSWTVAFVLFRLGYYIYEPNNLIAIIEAFVAGLFTLLSLSAFTLYCRTKGGL